MYLLGIFVLLSCKNDKVKQDLTQNNITFFEEKKEHFNYLKDFIENEKEDNKYSKTHYFYYTNDISTTYNKNEDIIKKISYLNNIYGIYINKNTEFLTIDFEMNRYVIDNRKFDVVFCYSKDKKIDGALQIDKNWYLSIKESIGM